ncbi:hypothetical protein Gorai_019608 [Gossypium raimondii]|uniref:Uncharacterized protein n=1 Tax=Gossypium raimondii TaxID=29730 RepID=A0A7J8PNQ9_GOSRA|nr:hypothetical protein [Gossypium raimondii]
MGKYAKTQSLPQQMTSSFLDSISEKSHQIQLGHLSLLLMLRKSQDLTLSGYLWLELTMQLMVV